MPYVLFVAGVFLIYIWASHRKEGFEGGQQPGEYELHMYYAEWCPHCHTALPEFQKLGATQTIGDKTVKCSAIEAEKNPEKVRGEVKGFPTIQLFGPDGSLVATHSGSRTKAGFLDFLKANVQ